MVHNEVACNKLRSASLVRYRRQHVLQLLQQFVQLTLVSADLLETIGNPYQAVPGFWYIKS
jgi:hypothetical protein